MTVSPKKIQQKTKIDDWFLRQIKDLIDLENKIKINGKKRQKVQI